MSLLGDVRRLAEEGPCTEPDLPCNACGFLPHQEECVWSVMPNIVAALEAIYGLMVSDDGAEPIEGDEWAFCRRSADGPHWDGCLWVKAVELVYRDGP